MRRAIPRGVWVLAASAALTLLAAAAVVAASVGPLVAHPHHGTGTPQAVSLPRVAPPTFVLPPTDRAPMGDVAWLWWVGLAAAIVVAAALVWWLVLLIRRPARPKAAAAGGRPAPLLGAMLGSLAETADVDLGDARSFRPARAADDIIRSWETIEAAAAALGSGKAASATPTEFLAAVPSGRRDAVVTAADIDRVDGAAARQAAAEFLPGGAADAADILLRLYHRARFDTAALTPGAATVARAAARALIAAWQVDPADTTTASRP